MVDGQTPDSSYSKLGTCADSWERAYIAACSAVVGVAVDIGLATSAGGDDRPVAGYARLVAVGAEASVVGLAVTTQVAGFCTALKALRHEHVTGSSAEKVRHSVADMSWVECG